MIAPEGLVTYAEMEAQLFARARKGMRLGLERMERALTALGRPDRCAPAFHVAGTNGKGSVCAMLDAATRAAGLRTGLYTSPHLERFPERFRVDGEPASEDALVALYTELQQKVPWAFDGADALTFFELVTLLAFMHFARSKVQVMVVEVGLGGRLDATNVLKPIVTCVTPVGLEHQEFLGNTLSAIAEEKAGIFKPQVPAIIARQPLEALKTIVARAQAVGTAPEVEGIDFGFKPTSDEGLIYRSQLGHVPGVIIALRGRHQRSNAAVAMRAIEQARERAGLKVPAAAALAGLANVQWPGRLETVAEHPEVLLDGAHNPPACEALANALEELYTDRRIHLVFGALADKDVPGMIEPLRPLVARIIATSPSSPRALTAEALAEQIPAGDPEVEVIASPVEAVRHAIDTAEPDDVVLVCGSLYLVGEARAMLRGGRVQGPGEILR